MAADDRRGAPREMARLWGPAAWMVSRRGCLLAAMAAVATMVAFGLRPGLDLAVAAAFYVGQNHFVGQTPGGEALRRVFADVPFAAVLVLAGLYLARRFGLLRLWAPSGRGMVFLLLSLALGPGLLVNVVLKDHAHRPRPVETDLFGGTLLFMPAGRLDGACTRNCSFVSGEGASAFWTVAPALLVPAAVQPPALAAALGFGCAASLLRMAFGGHYLSDTIMAALLVWLTVAGCWNVVMCRPLS